MSETRAEILAKAVGQTWIDGHPDGLLFREYLKETGATPEEAARIEKETRPYARTKS